MRYGSGGGSAGSLFSQSGGDSIKTLVLMSTAEELKTLSPYLTGLLTRMVQSVTGLKEARIKSFSNHIIIISKKSASHGFS